MLGRNDQIWKLLSRFSTGLFFCLLAICAGPRAAAAGWLYVLNDNTAGSQVYGFHVNDTTGELAALSGFPVLTGGIGADALVCERMAFDRANYRLYVINDGSDTLSAFSVNPLTGAITPLPFSPVALGSGTWNTIAIHPNGSPVVVSNGATGGGAVSFNMTATAASPATGSPFSFGAATAFSSVFSRDGNYLYVGGNTGNNVAGFSVNAANGVLTPLSGSPFNTGSGNPIAYAADDQGRLFVVNTGSTFSPPPIRVFTTTDGIPSPVTGSPFNSGLSQRRDALIHPNGNFYIVAGNSGNNVGVYQISGSGAATMLSAVSGSPFAAGGSIANVLAINLTGTHLYVANRLSRNITRYSMNPANGVLTNLGTQLSNTIGISGFLTGMEYVPQINRRRADFDGDGRTDLSVFRGGFWHILGSTAGYTVTRWGLGTDQPVPADYDGDGRTDLAVWREGTDGVFYIISSSTNSFRVETLGLAGDTPAVADWDGDGRADPAVYRAGAATGQQSFFYYRGSLNNPGNDITYLPWGINGDRPVREDFDGDGRADAAVFRPSNEVWYILQSSNGQVRYESWGRATDQLIPSDFDGDGRSDLAVFRPANNTWYIRNSSNGQIRYLQFGLSGDVLVPADYDGDELDDVAVFRPGSGTWHRLHSSNSAYLVSAFGQGGDVALPSTYLP